jgi:hypothetical protein
MRIRNIPHPIHAALTSVVLVLLVGCGKSNQFPVRGAVSLDGTPLASGTIHFRPVDPAVSRGGGATIRDGRYEIDAVHGLPAGKYLVAIDAYRLTGRMLPDATGNGLQPEVAPVVFAEKQPFEATISAESNNILDFRLTAVR